MSNSKRHVAVKELPDVLQRTLSNHGYGRKDISVEVSEVASMHADGGDGCRGFATLVELATGKAETKVGSWGGSNMFSPTNRVDLDTASRPLPEGFALVKGWHGGNRPTYAWITVNPANVAKMLPAGDEAELTDEEKNALSVFGLNSAGRKMVTNYRIDNPVYQSLIAKGMVKANKAGAMSITTKGKNARPRLY